MDVNNGSSSYHVGKLVADNGTYRIYLCTQKGTNRQCLLQVSTGLENNGRLDRQAYILRELARKSDELEAEYAKIKPNPDSWLNYGLGFPEVIDSFTFAEQGNRRINVLAFRNVEDVTTLVPLDNLTRKDKRRIDIRTSVWILGKLLKLLTFVHSEGFATGLMTGNNVVIEPNKHYPVIFDWSLAIMAEPGTLSAEYQQGDIRGAARSVLIALGSNLKTGEIPGADETTRAYTDYMLGLAKYTSTTSAQVAHQRFYEICDSIWERGFYPFTTLQLDDER
jgi:hypothetical protein